MQKNNLFKLCDWSAPKNVAIEHYDERNDTTSSPEKYDVIIKVLPYFRIRNAQRAIKKIILNNITSPKQQFIGIHQDIPIYCIPTLMLGILSSGHAFVYLSKDHYASLVESLNIKYFFFSQRNTTDLQHNATVVKKIIMHKKSLNLSVLGTTTIINHNNSLISIADDKLKQKNFAYAITTSGSTGTAVTVKVTHASLLSNILDFRERFELDLRDKIVQCTPLTFDPSMIEIFISFAAGATLVTFSEQLKNDPQKLLDILYRKANITFISTTPSLLFNRGWSTSDLRSTLLGKNSKLRVLMLGGETFPVLNKIAQLQHPSNNTRIFNVYGITEVSCWASINEIFFQKNNSYDHNDDDGEPIHLDLGDVLRDTIFQVRNPENFKHVIDEGEGLLYIGSNSRLCALDNERLESMTLPVFRNTGDLVKICRNGKIYFKGRLDSCIKRFGHKIYLNDLNFHVQKLNFISNSYPLISDTNKLYLFVTITSNMIQHSEAIANIWTHLQQLPGVTHPDAIHVLDHFATTKHGKICKSTLKSICMTLEGDFSVQWNAANVQRLLQECWVNHLACNHTNDYSLKFLDAGGSSIIALQIFAELTDRTQKKFANLIGMLLENQTLQECMDYIASEFDDDNIERNYNKTNAITIENFEVPKIPVDTVNMQVWQKCRGKTTLWFDDNNLRQSNANECTKITTNNFFTLNNNFLVEDCWSYNLGKCVDASPTIFGYFSAATSVECNNSADSHNKSAYVCVGSHLGMICTVELNSRVNFNKPNYKKWKIKLPRRRIILPRIESSILVLDKFKAVVGCHDGNIYCVHLKTGEIYWSFTTNNIVKCTAVISTQRENIFVGSYDHFLYCLSVKDGSLVWKREIHSSICSMPLVHDETNNVIIGLLNGVCICINQTSGELQWQYQLENALFSSPIALSPDIVIFADVCGNITSLNINANHRHNCNDDNVKLWNFCIDGKIFSDLVIHMDAKTKQKVLIITSKNNFLYKYIFDDAKLSPKLMYKIDCGFMIASTPWVNDSVIIIVREDGVIKMIDYKTGFFLYNFDLGSSSFSSPVLYNNFIAVGCRDDNLYIIQLCKK